jgi:predicted nucleic acid-binding protein
MSQSRIYLDACIVIYVVERHPVYSAQVETLMKSAAQSEFCYSPLVRMECLVMPLRTSDAALLKLYETFWSPQSLLDHPLAVFDAAAGLRANHSTLKTPDALHLATALHHGCTEFWTNDDRLKNLAPGIARKVIT